MRKQKARKIAKKIIAFYLEEAWNDLDSQYYKKYNSAEKELIKFYIHLYGRHISKILKIPYKPH